MNIHPLSSRLWCLLYFSTKIKGGGDGHLFLPLWKWSLMRRDWGRIGMGTGDGVWLFCCSDTLNYNEFLPCCTIWISHGKCTIYQSTDLKWMSTIQNIQAWSRFPDPEGTIRPADCWWLIYVNLCWILTLNLWLYCHGQCFHFASAYLRCRLLNVQFCPNYAALAPLRPTAVRVFRWGTTCGYWCLWLQGPPMTLLAPLEFVYPPSVTQALGFTLLPGLLRLL